MKRTNAHMTPRYAEAWHQKLQHWLGRPQAHQIDDGCDLPFLPPHHLHVFHRAAAHAGDLLVTNGFGRIKQPGTSEKDPGRYVELAALVDAPIHDVAPIVLVLARTLHVRGTLGLPVKSWRLATLPAPVGGMKRFLIVPLIRHELPSGRPINVFMPIPLKASDPISMIRRFPKSWYRQQNSAALCARWKKRPLSEMLSRPAL